ncbi:MAG: hypothetical protein H6940_03150 [Burkholderiales bacterium]|nr:hypothetical protein [Burkholderiales bacterium]
MTRDSLPQLVSHLTMDHIPKLREQSVDPEPLPEMIAENPDAWLDEHPPQGFDLAELFRQLNIILVAMVCCCYEQSPCIPAGWELTKALDFLLRSCR